MSRTRSLILLAGSFLLASSAWADELGYVDCAAHPENTQVFGKPRQTPDSVATVACGERFTILLNGFIFSRVQTKDGKVGYVYSSLITSDHSGSTPGQQVAGRAPAASAPAAPAANAHPVVANAATVNPAYAQPTSASQAASMPVTTSLPAEKPAATTGPLFPTPPMPAVTAADVHYSSSTQAAPAASSEQAPSASAASVQPASAASQPAAPAPAATSSAPASASVTPAAPASASAAAPSASVSTNVPAPATAASTQPTTSASSQPSSSAPAPAAGDPQPAPSAPAQSAAPAQPGPLFPTPPPSVPTAPASSAPDAAPSPVPAAAESDPVAQPQPEAAQPQPAPAPQPVRSVKARESWEAPVAGAHQSFLLELYSGYAFARFTSAGTYANLSGGLGSFGWNLKPWLQIVGDSSYNFATTSGAKSVLYGNHFGARYFYHSSRFGMGRRGLTPFVEALVGGSRVDTTVSGPGGYTTSVNCISYKAGGGIDFHFSPHWEVRLINVDYYRTTLGPTGSPAQNNYWASAGVVLRLFGARSE